MKRIFIFLIIAASMVSCGDKEAKDIGQAEAAAQLKQDLYSVVVDGTFPQNDSIILYYKLLGHVQYDKPVKTAVKGSELAQRLTIDVPSDVKPESFVIVASTNKEQKIISIPNITVMMNDKILVDGANYRHNQYFMTDQSFKWDDKNQRFELNHSNQYPPAFTGSQLLEDALKQ